MIKIIDENDDQTTQLRDNRWIISGTSVRGATHVRCGLPNQDSIRWLNSNKNNLHLLSIADGHGSEIHFRSKTGSYIATKVCVSVLNNFFSRIEVNVQNISQSTRLDKVLFTPIDCTEMERYGV